MGNHYDWDDDREYVSPTPKSARQKFLEEQEAFLAKERKLRALKIGDFIYEDDGWDIFKHEVIGIDLENMVALTLDHSLRQKPSTLSYWYTEEELRKRNY